MSPKSLPLQGFHQREESGRHKNACTHNSNDLATLRLLEVRGHDITSPHFLVRRSICQYHFQVHTLCGDHLTCVVRALSIHVGENALITTRRSCIDLVQRAKPVGTRLHPVVRQPPIASRSNRNCALYLNFIGFSFYKGT